MSAGNYGKSFAYASKHYGSKGKVVMPETAPVSRSTLIQVRLSLLIGRPWVFWPRPTYQDEANALCAVIGLSRTSWNHYKTLKTTPLVNWDDKRAVPYSVWQLKISSFTRQFGSTVPSTFSSEFWIGGWAGADVLPDDRGEPLCSGGEHDVPALLRRPRPDRRSRQVPVNTTIFALASLSKGSTAS